MAPSEQAIQLLKQGETIAAVAQKTHLSTCHVHWLNDCLLLDEAERIVNAVVAA